MDYMVKSMDKYSCPGLTEKAIMYMSGRKNECALKFHGYLLVRHMFYVDMAWWEGFSHYCSILSKKQQDQILTFLTRRKLYNRIIIYVYKLL